MTKIAEDTEPCKTLGPDFVDKFERKMLKF